MTPVLVSEGVVTVIVVAIVQCVFVVRQDQLVWILVSEIFGCHFGVGGSTEEVGSINGIPDGKSPIRLLVFQLHGVVNSHSHKGIRDVVIERLASFGREIPVVRNHIVISQSRCRVGRILFCSLRDVMFRLLSAVVVSRFTLLEKLRHDQPRMARPGTQPTVR